MVYKICSIVGARPQFIKSSPFSAKVAESKCLEEIIIHTGQHYDKNMSEVFFDEMGIPKPKYKLNINNLSHGAMTGKMIEQIEQILIKESPDIVNVYGDTNSTLSGALAASKLQIPLSHVEAGLRSFNKKMPEEINRILTDHVSNLLFCPSEDSLKNLRNENIPDKQQKVIYVGDIMKDSIRLFNQKNLQTTKTRKEILITIHREETVNESNKLREIIVSMNELSKDYEIIFPIHPRTKSKINDLDISIKFKTIEPVSFTEMIKLIKRSDLVITDSGGLQKEAYYLKTPCIITRSETEWVEMLKNDINSLCELNSDLIIETVNKKIKSKYIFDEKIYEVKEGCTNKIISEITDFLQNRNL
tara:strand:+ start:1980 stop:3059 length:1080 start_codon:yes stop_codon:yes gene_type:complete